MAENVFKDLLSSLKEATSSTFKKHESSNTVVFIKTSISKLDAIIKTLDKMLKKRNIDVGDLASKTKDKGKEYLEKGSKVLGDIKQKGFLETAKGKAEELQSKLTGMFKKENETGVSPPENLTEKEKAETQGNNDKAEEKTEKKQSMFSKMFSRSTEKAEKRKKEVEEEKKAVQEAGKKKAGSSWIGKILGAIGSAAGLIGGVVSKLGGFLLKGFGKTIGYLGGFVVKGLGKMITGIVPGIAGSIARLTSSLVGGGLKGAASLAGKGIMAAGRAALPFASGALQLAGRAALAIATGPVGWIAAAATAAYMGYKLYKYITRNNVADDLGGKLTRLRLLMYGFNDTKKDHYSKVFDLEMMMKDYIKFRDYKVTVDKLNNDDIDKILDIFKVSREEKDKYKVLNTWFVKRFMPAYKAFMQALYSVNNSIYVDEIDKLKPADAYNVVTRISVPTVIYDTQDAPTFEDTKIYSTKDEVDALLTNISNQCKDQANQKDPEMSKKIAEENKRKKDAEASKQTQPGQTKPGQKKAEESKPAPAPSAKQLPPDKLPGESDSPTDQKGGGQPDKTETKAANKLSKANGELFPGSTSLEGISTKLAKEKIYNLDPNVRELFTGMAKEYNSLTGKTIPVNEAFRSYEDQAALFAKYPGKAAKPGNSTHEFGLAVDINSAAADELDKLGLMRKYGFTRPIGGEKWHIEPIGVSLNPTLAKNDPNYRYKTVMASPGRGGDGYGSQAGSVMKKRDMPYQLSIYNKAGGETIDPSKAIKNPNENLNPKPEMSEKSKGGETKSTTPASKIDGGSSPTGGQVNKDTKTVMGADTEGEGKPTTNPKDKPLEKSESVTPTNPNTDVGKFADLGPEAAIKQAAKMTGMSEETMLAYAKMESSLKGGNIKNKKSSATGLFQIVGGTWDALVKKYGPKYGLPADAKPDNNYYNALMAMEYAKENLAGIGDYKSAGIDESTAIYLAHHYGLSGAKKVIDFLKKDPNTPMKDAVSGAAYKANTAAIGDNTVGGYVQKISNKISTAGGATKDAGAATKSSDTTSYASKSIATDVPSSPTSNNATMASKDSGFQKPVYKPEQSPYKTINTSAPAAEPAQPPAPQQSSVMNPKNMESLMNDQLSTLKQIASILTSIDGKFDMDKVKELASGKTPQAAPPAVDKSIPKGGVDLSRKSIQA